MKINKIYFINIIMFDKGIWVTGMVLKQYNKTVWEHAATVYSFDD